MANEQQPENQAEHLEVAAVEITALEVMEKAQIDMQIATAHRFPRSLSAFMKKATDMVSIDQETAAGCLYSRPVGKVDGRMKYAQGESIRLAEIVAACYSNLRVAAIITEITPRYVKAVGMAHDLESNYAFKAEVVESTVTRQGATYSERQRLVTAKAAQSKVIRDAIFRVVPKSLCKPIANMAKDIALGQGKTLEDRRKMVMEWVASLGIDTARVFDAMGIEGIEDLGQDHLIILTGVRTAVKEGDITVDEAFPKPESEQKSGVTGLKDRLNKNNRKPPPPDDTPDPKFQKKKAEQKDKLMQAETDAAIKLEEEELAKKKWHCNGCGLDFSPKDSEKPEGQCPKCLSVDISKPKGKE